MSFYLLFFLVLISMAIIISYIYFMKEKKKNLAIVEQGICPKCHEESIELVDQRSTGCSGPKMLTYSCQAVTTLPFLMSIQEIFLQDVAK